MPLWSHLFEKVITRINGAVFDMQMGKVFSVMRHDNEPALLTLNYQLRIDCLYVDNDCMTILNGQYLIEYVLGHVLFDIWIYVNLAFKSLNGLLIDPHLIQKVIVYTFWILLVIRIYHISLNGLLIDPHEFKSYPLYFLNIAIEWCYECISLCLNTYWY
jgi:hypothetical protein